MPTFVETTTRITYSAAEIAELIAKDISEKQGISVKAKDVHFSVYGGDPGGFGSMGDPQHVYNPPTPASFDGAEITVTKRSEPGRVTSGGGGYPGSSY